MDNLIVIRIQYYSVTVSAKAREIDVKGPKGSLHRSFKHIAIDITKSDDGTSLKVDMWFGNRETIAAIRYDSVVNHNDIHSALLMTILKI